MVVVMGRFDCIDVLFNYGVYINDKDVKGEIFMIIVRRLNRVYSERRMFFCYWKIKLGITDTMDMIMNKVFSRVKVGFGFKKNKI